MTTRQEEHWKLVDTALWPGDREAFEASARQHRWRVRSYRDAVLHYCALVEFGSALGVLPARFPSWFRERTLSRLEGYLEESRAESREGSGVTPVLAERFLVRVGGNELHTVEDAPDREDSRVIFERVLRLWRALTDNEDVFLLFANLAPPDDSERLDPTIWLDRIQDEAWVRATRTLPLMELDVPQRCFVGLQRLLDYVRGFNRLLEDRSTPRDALGGLWTFHEAFASTLQPHALTALRQVVAELATHAPRAEGGGPLAPGIAQELADLFDIDGPRAPEFLSWKQSWFLETYPRLKGMVLRSRPGEGVAGHFAGKTASELSVALAPVRVGGLVIPPKEVDTLVLEKCEVTGDLVPLLRERERLSGLVLIRNGLHVETLRTLAELSSLRRLYVQDDGLENETVRFLLEKLELSTFHIASNNVSEAFVLDLEKGETELIVDPYTTAEECGPAPTATLTPPKPKPKPRQVAKGKSQPKPSSREKEPSAEEPDT